MSKLINQSRLQQFATKLWEKIKNRYDEAFVNATLTPDSSEDKKLTFTRKSGQNQLEIDLASYARLTDKNDFKQDVSADNVAIANNKYMGSAISFDSRDRSLGFRQLTTNAFADGYVDHIKVYVDNTNAATTSTWKVWAITKGANGKESDRVGKVIYPTKSLEINTITENATEKKFVIIPIKESFEAETYFIVKCSTHKLEVTQSIKVEHQEDVVNLNNSQPPDEANSVINWGANAKSNTAIMYLYGRESIGSLSLKLNKTQADSSLYVKHSECTTEGGQPTDAGKVVKLGDDGKLHDSLMPSIAINEYIEVATFDHATLLQQRYENGDVVVVTSGGQVTKRYLCINKNKNTANLTEGFVELNSKDGVVQSVNGKVGAVELNLATTTDALKLTIGNGSGSVVEKSVDVITEGEITSMIENLQ